MRPDLIATRLKLQAGQANARDLMEASIASARSRAGANVFVSTSFESARVAADAADRYLAAGEAPGQLGGLAVSIKDLFDVAGEVTTAGSTVFKDHPPAVDDAPAVARLRAEGAAFIGRTNMSEFAFSGVGINPHYGTPSFPTGAWIDEQGRIPGGSTSGGAVSVAVGAAWAALGSDTGGSIRIPAALQGLVGFKSTARLVPTAGAVPLSTTLDTVSAITISVRDARLLHEVLAARRVGAASHKLPDWRFAVPRTLMLDSLDVDVARAFDRTLARLSAAGAQIIEIDLPLLHEVATINAGGGFAPVEAWAFHRRWLADRENEYDPRVARRIRRGEAMSAADYIDLIAARKSWIARMEAALFNVDVLLSPTVPMVAPPYRPLLDDDDAFYAANGLLLRNPSVVNFLDGCALTLPCHAADDLLPVGLMVWSTAMRDDDVLNAALSIEAVLAATAGAAPPR